MGQSLAIPRVIPNDWKRLDLIVNKIKLHLGRDSSPTFIGLTVTGLTASTLIGANASKALESVTVGTGLDYTRPNLTLSHLGIEALTDPGIDRIMFWDDSASACKWLGVGNSIAITNVTLDTIQDIRTSASPTFVGGTFSAVVTGVTPTAGTHFATKEYVDLAIGASADLFLSDNDDAVIADYHILYETDTGEATSTLTTDPMVENDDQLMFSYITASGVPGVASLRAGVYILHSHLSRGTGDKPTTFYWTLSKYTTGDVETVILTSEESSEIPNSTITFRTHATLISDATIDVTDRLVLKLYANVGAAGGNSEVTIHMEGTHDCHLTNQLPSSIWQNQGDVLDDLNTLGVAASDGQFIVATGAGTFAYESGATARTSLGLTIGTHVQAYDAGLLSLAGLTYAVDSFVAMSGANTFLLRTIAQTKSDLSLNLVENTALSTWAGSGNITTLGTIATGIWQATDVGIVHGGTGQSTAQLAINALSAVSGATNEHVLTKDTATGNAIFKVSGAGVSTFVALTDTPANFTGSAGKYAKVNAGENALEFGIPAGGSGGYSGYIKVTDTKAQNTNGGTFTSGAWQTRVLTTEDSDTDADCSLAANQITLTAGTYECHIICPCYEVNSNQARLYNTTGAAVVLLGSSIISIAAGQGGYECSVIVGRFTIAAGQVLEVQHYCNTTRATYGYGIALNQTSEVYTIAEFWKVGVGGDLEKVKVDVGATADYIGAASNDGVLRTGAGLSYTDGGDFVTLDKVEVDPETACRVAPANNLTIGTGSWTKVTLDSVEYDKGNDFDEVTNYRFTAPVAGVYLIVVNGYILDLGNGKQLDVRIYKNGATSISTQVWYNFTGGQISLTGFTLAEVELAQNDFIEYYVWHDHGSDRTLDKTATWIAIHRITG